MDNKSKQRSKTARGRWHTRMQSHQERNLVVMTRHQHCWCANLEQLETCWWLTLLSLPGLAAFNSDSSESRWCLDTTANSLCRSLFRITERLFLLFSHKNLFSFNAWLFVYCKNVSGFCVLFVCLPCSMTSHLIQTSRAEWTEKRGTEWLVRWWREKKVSRASTQLKAEPIDA